ncbi:MAG: radical SAM protein [Spirochaetales bacterium]|nr:radical SAM protein [Spirochaetales bacterium]
MADITPYEVSKYTILGKIKNSYDYFLINLLTGSADIVDEETAIKFRQGVYLQKNDLIKKGYLINQEDEKILFINSYCDICEKEEKQEILIHFIPWLSCNLSCDFCSFKELKFKDNIVSDSIVQSFFSYIDNHYTNKKKIIALSGGEPFLPGESYKKIITGIFHEAGSRGIPLRINTNGSYLQSNIPVLKDRNIEAIHVSLDVRNTPFENNCPDKDKNNYFEQVTEGIRLSLEHGFRIHVKILIGSKDIKILHLLAAFAEQSGWTDNSFFSAEIISRDNYLLCDSLHTLFPFQVDIAGQLYNQILRFPEILELYRPPFSVTRFLLESNCLPLPIFKACPGVMSELVCTMEGTIFPCIVSMMNKDECLGTFYPEVTVHKGIIDRWEERDVTTIKECVNCSLQLGCGGGCTIRAKEASGKYLTPCCIPVKQFMEAGLSLYFDKNLVSRE